MSRKYNTKIYNNNNNNPCDSEKIITNQYKKIINYWNSENANTVHKKFIMLILCVYLKMIALKFIGVSILTYLVACDGYNKNSIPTFKHYFWDWGRSHI